MATISASRKHPDPWASDASLLPGFLLFSWCWASPHGVPSISHPLNMGVLRNPPEFPAFLLAQRTPNPRLGCRERPRAPSPLTSPPPRGKPPTLPIPVPVAAPQVWSEQRGSQVWSQPLGWVPVRLRTEVMGRYSDLNKSGAVAVLPSNQLVAFGRIRM